MPQLSRMVILRTLSVIIVGVIVWIGLAVRGVLHTPRLTFDDLAPSPTAFTANESCGQPQLSTATKKLGQSLFPVSNSGSTDSWIGENHKMLGSLFRCIELSNCGPNQEKVIILTSFHFLGAFRGWVSGEDIWARSTVQALRDSGYTFLYALNLERTVQIYHMMPDLVKVVLVEASDSHKCFKDKENCILSSQNPYGIPAWKIHSFHFWTGGNNPLGRNWTLSPEDYALDGHLPNNYLGYSVEPTCLLRPFIAHNERDQAYVMAKRSSYFVEGRERAWPPHFYDAAVNATGIKLVLGANIDKSQPELPAGLTNYGMMTQTAFLEAVSKSLVLIGVGKPYTSPTPYEALCLGVPFINPIINWNRDNPQDRTKWLTQHWMLKLLDPPYVYNVFKGDLDGFIKAIEAARTNPIDRFVLERMRMSSVTSRVQSLVETDWKSHAAELLAKWKETGEGPLFTL